jgi:hypothetical protein
MPSNRFGKLGRFRPRAALRRGVLGDRVDGRSREGRFLTKCERELVTQVGGAPSFTQKLLIKRLSSRGMLRLGRVDEFDQA